MTETVADAAAFECLMEKRRKDYEAKRWDYHTFTFYFNCDKDGKPATDRDRRAACEMQKLALGTDDGFVVCTDVLVAKDDKNCFGEIGYTKRGQTYRGITLTVRREESEWIKRFWAPLTVGRKAHSGWGGAGPSGVACVFPGGCD